MLSALLQNQSALYVAVAVFIALQLVVYVTVIVLIVRWLGGPDMLGRIFREGTRPGLKFIQLFFLLFPLLIPLGFAYSLVLDRQSYASSQDQLLLDEWGAGEQIVAGPLLVVPYTVLVGSGAEDDLEREVARFAVFAPSRLTISGDVTSEQLRKGIFKRIGYGAQLNIDAAFPELDVQALESTPVRVNWQRAFVSLPLRDSRGVAGTGVVEVAPFGVTTRFESGARLAIRPNGWREVGRILKPAVDGTGQGLTTYAGALSDGVHAPLTLPEDSPPVELSFTLDLRASEALGFVPVGGQTNAEITSFGPRPDAFAIYPSERERVSGSDDAGRGTELTWDIAGVSRSFAPAYALSTLDLSVRAEPFGVHYPAGQADYQKILGGARYIPIFVGLLIATLFSLEARSGKRFHMVEYFFLAASFSLFLVMKTALAEHIGFFMAFWLSAVTMGSAVVAYVFRSRGQDRAETLRIGATVALLYLGLYVIYELPDYSLIIGVLITLAGYATAVLSTAGVKWYGRPRDPVAEGDRTDTDSTS